jgi:hypothetical protein
MRVERSGEKEPPPGRAARPGVLARRSWSLLRARRAGSDTPVSAESAARRFLRAVAPGRRAAVLRASRSGLRIGSADRGHPAGRLRWVRGSEAKRVISGEATRASSDRGVGATRLSVNGFAEGVRLRGGRIPRKGRSRLRRPRATGTSASAGEKGTHSRRGNSAGARWKAPGASEVEGNRR